MTFQGVRRPTAGLGLAAYTGALFFLTLASHAVSSLAVEGPSMAPALSPGFATSRKRDRVLFSHYKPARDLRRGDIVVFWTPHNPEKLAIKRVIALPGDEIAPFPDKPYADWLRQQARPETAGIVTKLAVRQGQQDRQDRPDGASELENTFELVHKTIPSVIVPLNHVWVEGDNWESTHDSNDYGPISQSLITGKALWILSPSRFGPIQKDTTHEPLLASRLKTHIGPVEEITFY